MLTEYTKIEKKNTKILALFMSSLLQFVKLDTFFSNRNYVTLPHLKILSKN